MVEDSSVGAAADAIESLLESAEQEPTQQEPTQDNESDNEEVAETETEVKAQTEAEESEETNDETPSEDEGTEGEDSLQEYEFEGATYALPSELKEHVDELKKGGMQEADYRKKTMELAEERRTWESGKQAELSKAMQQQLAPIQRELETYKQIAQAVGVQPPDESLIGVDNDEYLRQKDLWERVQSVQTQAEQDTRVQNQAFVADQARQLIEAKPSWSDKAVRDREMGEARDIMLQAGYQPHEVNNLADSKAWVLLSELAEHRKFRAGLEKQKKEVAKKITKVPAKVERPGVPSGEKGQRSKDAMARLRNSGSIDDAADAIMAQLG